MGFVRRMIIKIFAKMDIPFFAAGIRQGPLSESDCSRIYIDFDISMSFFTIFKGLWHLIDVRFSFPLNILPNCVCALMLTRYIAIATCKFS